MIGLRAALASSACCCERGTEVGPFDGDLTPDRAGLEGIDRVVSLPRDRLLDSNLFLLPAPFRWPGRGSPVLIYFVLLGSAKLGNPSKLDLRIACLPRCFCGQRRLELRQSCVCTGSTRGSLGLDRSNRRLEGGIELLATEETHECSVGFGIDFDNLGFLRAELLFLGSLVIEGHCIGIGLGTSVEFVSKWIVGGGKVLGFCSV